jgi:hypothetical protein
MAATNSRSAITIEILELKWQCHRLSGLAEKEGIRTKTLQYFH